MDSLTQFVLGGSVALAVAPKKNAKVALVGGLIATLPDLDIFYNHGNDLLNTVNHRGWTHSLIYLSLISPFIGWVGFRLVGLFGYSRWFLIAWMALLTHTLLDSFTIFGTSLFLPLSDMRVMTGSIFIIDPVYTVPLLFSIMLTLRGKEVFWRIKNFNTWALVFSHLYLLLSFSIQQALVPEGKAFATPTPFNIIKWRVVEINDKTISEYFVDIFGNKGEKFVVPNNQILAKEFKEALDQYQNFTNGFFNVEVIDDKMILVDLRMGGIEKSVFRFVIAELVNGQWLKVKPYRIMSVLNINQIYGVKSNKQ